MNTARRFRFRPRFRGLAASAAGLGALLCVAALAVPFGGASFWIALAGGGAGVVLGVLYLASPVWRMTVTADEHGLEVTSPRERVFQLAWDDVVKVVASPDTRTCFVDGGAPSKSLLVPGPGASAPYAIEDRDALYALIVERVAAERIEEVETLKAAAKAEAAATETE